MKHKHRCATKGCLNYYMCSERDCRIDWQCPACEDNELFDDIERMNQLSLAQPTGAEHHGKH